jgi:hypothetical protein
MPNRDQYLKDLESSQRYYEREINDRESKAFEYGLLVVKNGTLIAGGALLSIPTIVALAPDFDVDIETARLAGMLLGASLLVTILGAYVIHINWMLHAVAYEEYRDRDFKFLHRLHIEDDTEVQPDRSPVSVVKWIWVTFWIPHLCAISYVVLLSSGLWHLYQAFGVAS